MKLYPFWLKQPKRVFKVEMPGASEPPTPVAPKVDWRNAGEERWTVVKEAGDFMVERRQYLMVDMESGEERWMDKSLRHYPYWPEERTLRKSAVAE